VIGSRAKSRRIQVREAGNTALRRRALLYEEKHFFGEKKHYYGSEKPRRV
jgi:hypothetical protein